jgi:hypothetical protein
MVDVNRHLTVKWVEAADTLTGVVRDQAESAADVAREMPASVGHVVHVQAAKAEQERVRPERPSTSRPGRPMTRPASATRA